MRLVFMGSPAAVLAPLEGLLKWGPDAGHDVVAVVSQPAKPVGRRGKPVDPPVAALAREKGLNVLQPQRARDSDFLDELRSLQADVIITAAYGQILSKDFLAIPTRATINIHPSLLPAYRGATPVPAALLDGCSQSGVTILFTVFKLDAGNIIVSESSPIDPDETAGDLTYKLFKLGGDLLPDALDKLSDVNFTGEVQDDAKVTMCRKISKDDGLVKWQLAGLDIYNRFRAYEPWPGTHTYLHDLRVNISRLKPVRDVTVAGEPGCFAYNKKMKMLMVATGEGTMGITRVKPAGRKDIDAASFWNGLKDKSATRFTSPAP